MTANTTLIKELNKKLIREQLRKMREATIIELARGTGLSVVTVKSLLVELIKKREVREGETIPSNGGRPSTLYIYNEKYRYGLVIYGYQKNSSNFINISVTNLYGECVYREELFLEDIQVESFSQYIDKAIKKYPHIGTIGFGLPGVEEDGIVVSNDYCGIVGDAFMSFYKQKYGLPIIFINDVNAAVKGFFSDRSSKDCPCLVGVYFPRIYPPGAGMVINAEIYTGAHGFAGEIGHLLPNVDWMRLNYSDTQAVTDAVSALIAVYCRVVAPNQFVLYGDFLDEAQSIRIQMHTQSLLNQKYKVNVTVSADFEKDFERGMVISVLEQLNDTL
jgi:hypothetical protein